MRKMLGPVALLLALLACKQLDSTPRFTGGLATGRFKGNYTITAAFNGNGSGAYTGKVNIDQTGEYYTLTWNLPGNPPYRGVGVEHGDVLAVGWSSTGMHGVHLFVVEGGKLSGVWAANTSNGKLGRETLQGPAGLNGLYQIESGTTPDGLPRTGTVTIRQTGRVYDVTWTMPSGAISGVGVKSGNVFVVGWLQGRAGGNVVYIASGKSLVGQWAQPGFPGLGAETLVP